MHLLTPTHKSRPTHHINTCDISRPTPQNLTVFGGLLFTPPASPVFNKRSAWAGGPPPELAAQAYPQHHTQSNYGHRSQVPSLGISIPVVANSTTYTSLTPPQTPTSRFSSYSDQFSYASSSASSVSSVDSFSEEVVEDDHRKLQYATPTTLLMRDVTQFRRDETMRTLEGGYPIHTRDSVHDVTQLGGLDPSTIAAQRMNLAPRGGRRAGQSTWSASTAASSIPSGYSETDGGAPSHSSGSTDTSFRWKD
jgi:hypothetical protein